jgi:lipopolysaccharide export system permease protein
MNFIIYRYLAKEQLLPLAICFLGLSLVLITGRLMQLTQYLFTSSLTLLDFIEIIAFAMPKLILYVLPMASLVGVLLGFIRLNNDNELIAFRTAGISFFQLAPPVVVLLTVVSCVAFINTLYVMPLANRAFKDKLMSVGRASLPALLKEGVFIDTIPGLIFFFHKVDPAELAVQGVFIQDERQTEVLTIVGKRAEIFYQKDQNHLTFLVDNGIITRVGDDFTASQAVSFKSYELSLSLDELFDEATDNSKGKREMTLIELYQKMQKGPSEAARRYGLEFHQRLALPLSCLLLGLISVPLGTIFNQRSRMTGITFGLCTFLAYYVILSAGKGFAETDMIPAWAAVWTPNVLTLSAAVYLWTKSQRETPFRLATFLQRFKPVRAQVEVPHACKGGKA